MDLSVRPCNTFFRLGREGGREKKKRRQKSADAAFRKKGAKRKKMAECRSLFLLPIEFMHVFCQLLPPFSLPPSVRSIGNYFPCIHLSPYVCASFNTRSRCCYDRPSRPCSHAHAFSSLCRSTGSGREGIKVKMKCGGYGVGANELNKRGRFLNPPRN